MESAGRTGNSRLRWACTHGCVWIGSPARTYWTAQGPLLGATRQPRWEGRLGENRCMYMSGWVPSRFTETTTALLMGYRSVRSLSRVRLSVTPWTAAHQASLSITNSRSPPKPVFIESVMPSSHLILCRPRLLLPSIFPSIGVFSSESALCICWPKYWSFSFSISPSNECSGLGSFRMDWLDLLTVQGTLRSLLQHHSSKPSTIYNQLYTNTK